jgi:predicted RecA/RadA family phage recombinase
MALATYVKKGSVVEWTNGTGSAVAAWEIVTVGSRIAVAGDAIANGASGNLFLEGVFSMAAVNDAAFAIGDQLYWDASANKLTKVATAYFAGMCVAAKGETDTTAKVKLCDGGAGGGAVPLGSVELTELSSSVQASLAKADASVAGVAAGYKEARSDGAVAVTGTLEVTSGLATVKSVTASLAEDVAATGAFVSVLIPTQTGGNAGKFTVKVWKSDLSAADAAKNVTWIAVGT